MIKIKQVNKTNNDIQKNNLIHNIEQKIEQNNVNQGQFINFINHLLTFNKQMELLYKQKPNERNKPFRFNISSSVIIKLCELVKPILKNQPNVLHINSPLNIFGDIHGQFSDMIHFLEMTGLPPAQHFLFMGDYVDRGNNSVEVCALLFAMKIMFPQNISILRGNHECPEVNSMYGFLSECESRYGNEGKQVFNKINDVLCILPLCAIVSEKIFCVHGGISPHLKKIDDINKINRFTPIPDGGLLCDLMWSDPNNSLNETWGMNARGISCTYNATAIDTFLTNNNLQLICRAHQLVSDGYKFTHNNKLITVFSAPNYCGNSGNDGAVMKINEDLVCSFIIIKPTNE
jgi:serine/threonine-protein phosphatase PP1 catalytic subunit